MKLMMLIAFDVVVGIIGVIGVIGVISLTACPNRFDICARCFYRR